MNFLHDIEIGEKAPEEINVVIENCKGSSNKIEYDTEKGVFRLDRVFYSAVYWPFEYGFIPKTWQKDRDPLDVAILVTQSTFPGCIMKVRPLGVIKMEDEKGIDNKIIGIPVEDPTFSYDHVFKHIKDISPHIRREIKDFFGIYKHLEPRKWVKTKACGDAKEAKKLIKQAMEEYRKKFKKKITKRR
jgi:inorganic pyrophosphatase